ncbi:MULTISPECIES: GH25 family lysozyme [Vagococcus]|uniref:GH25 family lysozyme n=1 Tax=Vagococcus TaxID=2737 RepID=UPI001314F785|nr:MULTISPECIES: GH25 family lysozyme [Vagococcus]
MKKNINIGLCLLLFSSPILSLASETTTESSEVKMSEKSSTQVSSDSDTNTSSDVSNHNNENQSKESKERIYLNGEVIEIDSEPDALKNVEEQVVTEDNQKAMGDTFKSIMRSFNSTAFSSNNKDLPRMDFVDVSSHQGEITVNDYLSMKKQGVTGVVVKLTESTSYTNPYAKSQINNAKAAGLKVSAYHYSWFKNKQTAEAEATYFANTAKSLGLGTDVILVNDAEESSINNGRLTENSLYFASTLSNKFGYKNVHHYSMASWFKPGTIDMTKLGGEQFSWKANFVNNPSKNNLLYQSSSAWQWSSQLQFVNDRVSGRLFDINIDYKGNFSNPSYIEDFEQTPITKRKYINKNNGVIYERPYTSGVSQIDTTQGMKGQLIYLTAQSQTDYGLWYKFSYTKNGINYSGWIKSTDLDDVIEQQSINKTFIIKNNNGAVYDRPYTETTQRIDTTNGTYGSSFKATKSATTGYGLWYYGTYIKNNQTKAGWIKSTDLGNYSNHEFTTGYKYVNKDYGEVYNEPYEGSGTKRIEQLTNMQNVIFSYTEKATTDFGIWYKGTFYKNGKEVIGWIKSTDLSDNYYSKKDVGKRYVTNNNGVIYDTPHNYGHTKEIGKTSNLNEKYIEVTKSVKTPSGLWYESTFKLADKKVKGWIKSTDITLYHDYENVSGKFYVNKDVGVVYDRAYDGENTRKVNDLRNMQNVIFSYTEKATTDFGIWYKGTFIKNGQNVTGWIKSVDLDRTYRSVKINQIKTINVAKGVIYDSPYNEGYTSRLGNLSDLNTSKVRVSNSVKTPYGIWYETTFNKGNTQVKGWIKSTDFK